MSSICTIWFSLQLEQLKQQSPAFTQTITNAKTSQIMTGSLREWHINKKFKYKKSMSKTVREYLLFNASVFHLVE